MSFVACTGVLAQMKWNQRYQTYINQYRDLAIEQMLKFKIPASITLAQGLLESGAGYSELATKGNNHFGIKCHDGPAERRIMMTMRHRSVSEPIIMYMKATRTTVCCFRDSLVTEACSRLMAMTIKDGHTD